MKCLPVRERKKEIDYEHCRHSWRNQFALLCILTALFCCVNCCVVSARSNRSTRCKFFSAVLIRGQQFWFRQQQQTTQFLLYDDGFCLGKKDILCISHCLWPLASEGSGGPAKLTKQILIFPFHFSHFFFPCK